VRFSPLFKGTPRAVPDTRLLSLDAVVVSIALGDMAFSVLRLACSAPPLCGCLVLVEDRLLWERLLGQDEVSRLQLQRQKGKRSAGVKGLREDRHHNQKHTRSTEKITTHKFFRSLVGEHQELPRQRPQVGRPSDRLRHTTRRWTSSDNGRDGTVTVPAQGGRSAVISQRRSGRLRSGTTP
jgi:hypothetical protein